MLTTVFNALQYGPARLSCPRTRVYGVWRELGDFLCPACPAFSLYHPPLLTHSLTTVVDFSHYHGTYHSFDVPEQSSILSMINVFFILTIA